MLWTHQFSHAERRVDAAELERTYERFEPYAARWQISETAVRRILRNEYYSPERQPPVSAAVTGKDGTLWVRREADGKRTYLWDAISPAGERIRSLRLPRRFEALRGERAGIWGVLRDENDVPSVVRYRLQ